MGERAKFFTKLIDSSEMMCSLRYEDIKGCPYNAFTSRDIIVLSATSALLGIVSLFFGG